ncbi:MAG: hypothetical protein KC425_08485, partial [Anaerolineales bacterium]|nr:hypothetical protein [Anaerolineales bacterium]
MTAYWPRLHRQIHANFTLEDVRTLCFNLSVDFDDLAGEGKTAIIWSLLRHLFDHKRIPDLLAELRRKRPSIPWPDHDPTIPFFQPDPKRAGARQELPQGLRLKLFEVSGAHYDEIVFVQRQVPLYTDYRFGLALLNPFQEQLAVTGV